MRYTKLGSLILAFIMMFSIASPEAVLGEESKKQTPRRVYLHARGKDPAGTYDFSEVLKDETTYLYFAIDDPNNLKNYDDSDITSPNISNAIKKAVSDTEENLRLEAKASSDKLVFENDSKKQEYIDKYISDRIEGVRNLAAYRGEQMARHTKPWDDLNGYTVKIYFDNTFFEFADTETTNASKRIDYTIPNKNITSSDFEGVINGIGVPESIGYYPEQEGSGVVSGNISCAYVRVFFSGTFLPKEENPDNWFNLCALPLKPKKTGTTQVYIDINTADEYTLELFAKHDSESLPTFQAQAQNGGKHTIIIKDSVRPNAPWATPTPADFVKGDSISLKCDDMENYNIYYTVNGSEKKLYTKPFTIDSTSVINCYCVKKTDTEEKNPSNTVSYKYEILPDKPLLFIGDGTEKTLITNVHNEKDTFTVYADNALEYDGILEAGTYIYYTFTDSEVSEYNSKDSDWVKLTPNNGNPLEIDSTKKVRLITVKESLNGAEISDVSVYLLGIMPGEITANPTSGEFTEPTKVTLECKKNPEAEIYYTLDGSDPRENGIKYTEGMITVTKDTTIRAVGLKDGIYGDVETFFYKINSKDSPIEAYLPSGEYEGECNVTLVTDSDDEILYSIDNGKSWETYKKVIQIKEDTTIIAKKKNSDKKYSFIYDIKPTAPVFVPESTHFSATDTVTIYSPDSVTDSVGKNEYTLYYTLNGDDPTDISKAIEVKNVLDTATVTITDYTVIKAIVCKNGDFSRVVEHTYNVNPTRPAEPVPTLNPGYYTQKIGENGFSTGFLAEQDGVVEIYYTVSYDGKFVADPVSGKPVYYDKNTPIDIKGRTIIKAIAVDVNNNTKSEVGIFEYIVTPEPPKAATEGKTKTRYIPVKAVEESIVNYKMGDYIGSVLAPQETFYIDMETGLAYKDVEGKNKLDPNQTSNITNKSENVLLELSAKLDGIESEKAVFRYSMTSDELAPPYADKPSGIYEEYSDGKNRIFKVKLDSLNLQDTISYRINGGEWKTCNKGDEIILADENTPEGKSMADIVLQLRASDGTKESKISSYIYEFIPPSPVISLKSGRYIKEPPSHTVINYSSSIPQNEQDKYEIYYRDGKTDIFAQYRTDIQTKLYITDSTSYKAYTVNSQTGKRSKNAISYYVVESDGAQSGQIYTTDGFAVADGETLYIDSYWLDKEGYREGIKLLTKSGNRIMYKYTYNKVSGGSAGKDFQVYDQNSPIIVNSFMKDIVIEAYLIDKNGTEIKDSRCVFKYEFIDLGIPTPSLEKENKTIFASGTKYTIDSIYDEKDNIIIYYTLDGTDPISSGTSTVYGPTDESLELTETTTTVKTVYYKACGLCQNAESCTHGIWGEPGEFKYSIEKTVGGGGGGGSSGGSNKTRKYTVDVFGYEHPTHIGYINGYPDGSVKPDSAISREEVVSILYRIKNHDYESPFEITGTVFPDVELQRWSVRDIEYMTDKNVITGYPDGEFKPTAKLTRAEFAAIIYRFVNLGNISAENKFTDLSDGHWAYNEIVSLCAKGYINGYEDNSFRPENNITRAEVMTVINKILGRKPLESYVKSLDFNPFNDLYENKWYYVDVLEATITHNYWLNNTGYEYKWENWK